MGQNGNDVKPKGLEIFFYEGYKARQEPRAVIWGGKTVPIAEILSRERHRDSESDTSFETFLCRLENGARIRLKLEGSNRWEIEFID
ncbi:hypothetical protein ACFLT9_02025 [Acidobacteriota bacterium]